MSDMKKKLTRQQLATVQRLHRDGSPLGPKDAERFTMAERKRAEKAARQAKGMSTTQLNMEE